MAKTREVATRTQVIACYEALKPIICTMEGSDLVYYKEGFDDSIVAQKLGMTRSAVKSVRNEMFGRLRNITASRTAQIDPRIDILIDRFNKLVIAISLNRIVDVKHLEIKSNGS